MPLKHNKINSGVSSAKNTPPPSKMLLLEEIIASQNIFLNFFKLSPNYGEEASFFS